ncbi:MAG: PadR family transcriptional regulator [Phycisphaerales bacterium]|nr:PadR family transcriptional regulator [Phycisphaerales bacterium]
MPNRSELECFVLGLIWQYGPVSAYGVRRQMRESPSRQWSASTGAIYPALRRLERDGLILGRELHRGKRRRREYEITRAGLGSLRGWVGPPLGEETLTVTYDPLRSRARFLGALSPRARVEWVDGALRALDEVEAKVRAWSSDHDGEDPFLIAVTMNALLETESRRRWLERLRRIAAGERGARGRSGGVIMPRAGGRGSRGRGRSGSR